MRRDSNKIKSVKLKKLKKTLKRMKSAALAFSGGVDSSFLLKVAFDTLGRDNVLAVIAESDYFPRRERAAAEAMARQLGLRHLTIKTKVSGNKDFLRNPPNRCYYCKRELFGRLKAVAAKNGISAVIDGSNYDDRRDLRYGAEAAREFGVRSPLAECRIGKKDIRRLSRALGLKTWDKPASACLVTRFPYNEKIKKADLRKIERAEDFLRGLGLGQVRVRAHGDIARIELDGGDIRRLTADRRLRGRLTRKLKKLGFTYIALDMEGYRSGSMNESLKN